MHRSAAARHGRRALAAPAVLLALSVAVAAASCRQTAVDAAETGAPPDILLVLLDAARPDHFGAYGYGRDTTPNLDRLAGESLLFRAYAARSPTW